jgi:hypothetical protein
MGRAPTGFVPRRKRNLEIGTIMISITTPDGSGVIEVTFVGNDPFGVYGADFIRVDCHLMYRGQSVRTEAIYTRESLVKLGRELSEIHRELNIGAATSLWSSQGNVAITFVLGIRGSVLVSAILVEVDRRSPRGLFAHVTLDQTYLPEIARQAEELSREYTSYSD